MRNTAHVLTELKLRNFKAFADTQRLPIKPLTLIFGANSSGKSSLIHGLLLCRHLWQRGNPDAHQLKGLAEMVDLGGFRQYVFGHDENQTVELEIQFAVPEQGQGHIRSAAGNGKLGVQLRVGLDDLKSKGSLPKRLPRLQSIEIQRDGINLARLLATESGNLSWDPDKVWDLAVCVNPDLAELDKLWRENIFRQAQYAQIWPKLKETIANASPPLQSPLDPEYVSKLEKSFAAEKYEELKTVICKAVSEQSVLTGRTLLDPEGPKMARIRHDIIMEEAIDEVYNAYFGNQVGLVVGFDLDGFLEQLSAQFCDPMIYLGPLRFYPPRHFSSPHGSDPSWQSGGGQAWWKLFGEEAIRIKTNNAMRRMSIPYQIQLREWQDRSNPSQILPELVLLDKVERPLSARDIGVGVSQVIPVIASAFGASGSVLAIEQPEIHLHPALQAELGDVFIESALGERKNTLILETHSEHLILRILRRVRETTEGKLESGATPVKPEDVSVAFVEPTADGSIVRHLAVTPDGDFAAPWPGGFFAERFKDLP